MHCNFLLLFCEYKKLLRCPKGKEKKHCFCLNFVVHSHFFHAQGSGKTVKLTDFACECLIDDGVKGKVGVDTKWPTVRKPSYLLPTRLKAKVCSSIWTDEKQVALFCCQKKESKDHH